MAVSRTWYVPCSPRSPEKIAPELAELAKLEGVRWRERNAVGDPIHQIAFAESLKRLESFEGHISASDPAFSARDRFAPMQTLGFAFVDSAGVLRITPAGYRLIEGVRVQELFLKQMLKWQYPSWQHGGNPRTRRSYPPVVQMDIFPFVETLRVCRDLGGLSKREIAIFLLPALNRTEIPRVTQMIAEFRAELGKRHGRDRMEFVQHIHREHFRQVYSQEIAASAISTRESPTATVEEFIAKKVRNSVDVADAVIRYFRATGLFTLSSDFHGLAISPLHEDKIEYILTVMRVERTDTYYDVDRFYEYMGNPDLPPVPWESPSALLAKAIALGVPQHEAEQFSASELGEVIEQQERVRKTERLREYAARLQTTAAQEIAAMFDRIRQRDVVDPALFLEWNVWRAMLSMNDCCEVRPNFTLDDDLQPFVALKDSTNNGAEWGRQIPRAIETWKQRIQSPALTVSNCAREA